jgi:hypothetical protein
VTMMRDENLQELHHLLSDPNLRLCQRGLFHSRRRRCRDTARVAS